VLHFACLPVLQVLKGLSRRLDRHERYSMAMPACWMWRGWHSPLHNGRLASALFSYATVDRRSDDGMRSLVRRTSEFVVAHWDAFESSGDIAPRSAKRPGVSGRRENEHRYARVWHEPELLTTHCQSPLQLNVQQRKQARSAIRAAHASFARASTRQRFCKR
jgi:hypothetical protein